MNSPARMGFGMMIFCALVGTPGGAGADEPSAIRVGTTEQAHWSDTTAKAAKTAEEQQPLQQGKVATVTGEIVDVSCYLQLNKRGQGHIACGSGCVRNGQPIGLVTADRQLYLIVPEEHDPRRGGLVDIRAFFADHMGQTAMVTGMLVVKDGYRAIFVAGAPLTTTPATPREAAR